MSQRTSQLMKPTAGSSTVAAKDDPPLKPAQKAALTRKANQELAKKKAEEEMNNPRGK